MPVRIGFLSSAHMHAWGYANGLTHRPEAEIAGIWDEDAERAQTFAKQFQTRVFDSPQALLDQSDGAIVCTENKKHIQAVRWAAEAGKPILCEKPLVTSADEWQELKTLLESRQAKLMTAFPCRYSPAFRRMQERLKAGEIGELRGICATNRGRCPGGWFVQPELSGGGAMIDHVVHVADLLRVLLGQTPKTVHAFSGHNMHRQTWEDTGMLTLEYESGLFVTLDSSWSRPKTYKTWGDVTMNLVGDQGVLELDLFSQASEIYADEPRNHYISGFGTDLDRLLVADFVKMVQGAPAPITAEDGWQAVRVALAAYQSAQSGQPATLPE